MQGLGLGVKARADKKFQGLSSSRSDAKQQDKGYPFY